MTDDHVKRVEAVVWPLCLSAESSPGSHCSSCGIPARPPSSTLDVAFLWLVLHQQCNKVTELFSGMWSLLLWLVLQHLDIAYGAPGKNLPARPPSSTLDVAFLWLVLHHLYAMLTRY